VRTSICRFFALLPLAACSVAGPTPAPPPAAAPPRAPALALAVALSPAPSVAPAAAPAPAFPSSPVVARARLEVARGVSYDPAWFAIGYPNGDPAPDKGVCTDVVIRSLRAAGIDLQELVHDDIVHRPAAYATVARPDRNIDHRRVSPMLVYLRAHTTSLPTSFDETARATWQPGDVVVWAFRPCPACTPDHVGIVSDRPGPRGLPLVLHNIGPTPSEDDRLDAFTVLGHFRVTGSVTGSVAGQDARERPVRRSNSVSSSAAP
jgi:uncharacterized protein YijF (DUF1287 family)